jgi:F0F1-type ATP synthase membrane subunit b/b'
MIQDRIDKIEATLKDAQNLSGETREELLKLLADLRAEVSRLTATHGEDADSIARFADASVHEAMRSERKPEQAATALKGLTASVEGFEASHPRLVEIVDRLAITLSNMGI